MVSKVLAHQMPLRFRKKLSVKRSQPNLTGSDLKATLNMICSAEKLFKQCGGFGEITYYW